MMSEKKKNSSLFLLIMLRQVTISYYHVLKTKMGKKLKVYVPKNSKFYV